MAMYTRPQTIEFLNNTDPTDAFSILLDDEIVTPLPQAEPAEGEPAPEPIYMTDADAQLYIANFMAWALFNNPDHPMVYFAKSAALQIRWNTLSMVYLRTKVYAIYFQVYKSWLYNQVSSGQMTPEQYQKELRSIK